jgi:hypothetical protein
MKYLHPRLLSQSSSLDERLQLIQGTGLNFPSVNLVAVAQDVILGRLVAPEEVLHPRQPRPSEFSAVGREHVATMAEGQIALPRRRAGREGLEIPLTLCLPIVRDGEGRGGEGKSTGA